MTHNTNTHWPEPISRNRAVPDQARGGVVIGLFRQDRLAGVKVAVLSSIYSTSNRATAARSRGSPSPVSDEVTMISG